MYKFKLFPKKSAIITPPPPAPEVPHGTEPFQEPRNRYSAWLNPLFGIDSWAL
jgi:hypothetical protein